MSTLNEEYPAARDLYVAPELGTDDPMCGNCRYAMTRIEDVGNFVRCDLHGVRMDRQESCPSYVPSPELEDTKKSPMYQLASVLSG